MGPQRDETHGGLQEGTRLLLGSGRAGCVLAVPALLGGAEGSWGTFQAILVLLRCRSWRLKANKTISSAAQCCFPYRVSPGLRFYFLERGCLRSYIDRNDAES